MLKRNVTSNKRKTIRTTDQTTTFKRVVYCSLCILLSACGGSSGGETDTTTTDTSAPTTTPSTPAPANSAPTGTISISGQAYVGNQLTVLSTIADSNGLGDFSYQWLVNNNPIDNATATSFTPTTEHLNQQISIQVSYTDGDGFNESLTSEQVTVIAAPATSGHTNILLIISDDQGLDASNQYPLSNDTPVTPNLDTLANQGVVFENTWATPACTTTRATLMTGKHGVNSGVTFVPAQLDSTSQTLARYLKNSNSNYQTAAFGKWHLGGGNSSATHPNDSGFDYYAGNLGNISDYFNWTLTTNGQQSQSSQYHTSHITDLAIDWINNQSQPWFAWLAYSAPHSPFHLPPSQLLSNNNLSGTSSDISANPRDYYLAAVEAMDTEIGRLLNSISADARANTIILFIGDNGTPRGVIDTSVYQAAHSKGTLYQGGIQVPMLVAGKGVNRAGERESSLINSTDFYATIGQLAGIETEQIYNSVSFKHLLSDDTSSNNSTRTENYSEFDSDNTTGWSVRSNNLKLINYQDGRQELFDLSTDRDENNDLSTDSSLSFELSRLTELGLTLRGEQSNNNNPIDITNQIFVKRSANCQDYAERYQSSVMDVNNSTLFNGSLTISVNNNKCVFQTNAIPNHDFNDGLQSFANDVSAQNASVEVTTSPTFASTTTPLSLSVDNALLLNGVKVDLLAAGCFGIGNGKVGCNDDNQPWRFDPMFAANGFNIDSHNAHAQPNGEYHYHGTPNAFYHAENNGSESPVVGFAADGFPIFGPYFNDNGTIRKAEPSYHVRAGNRPSGDGNPGGIYDGSYRDDYEYIEGSGDLDECNGMTINGVYGYYITDHYPYVLACFKGTPDPSFNKR